MVSNDACSRCLLTKNVPGVTVANDGICSVCKEYDRVWGDWDNRKEEKLAKLKRILYSARKKKRFYDVLVPLSGGKDSTYVLYLCRKHFNLKCLAVTFDNGFLSEQARENISNVCKNLGVDHTYYGMSKPFLMRLYRFFFLKTGFFCPVCMNGISVARNRIQLAFNIPLSVQGTSRRTEEHVAPEYFLGSNLSFMENVLKDSPFEKEVELLLTPPGFLRSPAAIKMPDYLDWEYDEIYNTITKELGWKTRDQHAEHADCKVAGIVDFIRYKKFPELIPEMLRFSKIVTSGQMTRAEAKKRVAENKSKMEEPSNLNWFFQELEITKEDMDTILSEPLRHYNYLKDNSRILRRLRSIKKKRFLLI